MTDDELEKTVLENQSQFGVPSEDERNQTPSTFDPVEVEKESLKTAEQAAQDPIGHAMTMYGLYMPKFKQGVKKLSSRARARLLMALIEYPLNEIKYQHSTQHEKEMMAIGDAVLQAKFLMILHTMHNSEKLEKALDQNQELTEEEVASILEENPELEEGTNEQVREDD